MTRRPSSISPRRIRRWATSKARAKYCRKSCTRATTSRRPRRRGFCRSSPNRRCAVAGGGLAGRRLFFAPVAAIVDSILDSMRIALGLEYDGSPFHGWQSQSDGSGVQDALEKALGAIAGEPVRAVAAGRTDAGVHATAQVVHFETDAARPETAWVRGVNALLPEAVAVRWALPVPESFHARFAATGRRYTYLLLDRPVRPALCA